MSSVVENESQLEKKNADSPRSVPLEVIESGAEGSEAQDGVDDRRCDCQACDCCLQTQENQRTMSVRNQSTSIIGQAACVMVGARLHASEKADRRRLGSQALHWGVLMVAVLLSISFVMPTLSLGAQDWLTTNILHSPGNWKLWVLSTMAASLLSFGFVSRLGTERVHGGCAMLRRLGPATLLGIAWSAIPSFAGVMLILNMEPIRLALVGDGSSVAHLMIGMSIYLVGFVILAGFGCLPTVSQAILAGYAFGLPMGLGVSLIGFGGASLVGYAFVERVARSRVEKELQSKPKAILLRDALIYASPGRALLLVTLLRASPGSPFALTNLLLGSLGVSRGVFFVGTVLGMIPRTLAAVLIGTQITTWGNEIDKPRWMIVVGIIAIVILIVVISKIAATALRRVASNTEIKPYLSEAKTSTKTDTVIEPKSSVEITSGL